MALKEAIQNIWSSDYVQKNPNKAYKAQYNAEYLKVAAFINGGPEPVWSAFTKLGKGLCEAEVERRKASPTPIPPEPIPQPPTGSTPPAIANQGYSLKFEDKFDTLDANIWTDHQWWESKPPVNTVFVQNGTLQIVRRRTNNYPPITVSSEPHGSGTGKSFQYGYFEASLKFTTSRGSGPAFWLFSTRHATNGSWPQINPYCAANGLPAAQCYTSELDVFEGHGNKPNIFNGTLHRNTSDFYGANDQMNDNNWIPQPAGTDLGKAYHTYAALWNEQKVIWYLDDVKQMEFPCFDSTHQPMHLLFYNWSTPWEDNVPDNNSAAELKTEVDWVRVWQK